MSCTANPANPGLYTLTLAISSVSMQDTHDLLEEQESRLSQRVEGNSESIQKIADELHGLHDKLEASAEHIVTRVDDVSKDVSREAARLDEELHAVAAELGGRVDRLDSKVSQLNDQRELDRERLSTAVAEVEHDLRARVDSVDQGFAAKLAELAASVKQQVSAAAADPVRAGAAHLDGRRHSLSTPPRRLLRAGARGAPSGQSAT